MSRTMKAVYIKRYTKQFAPIMGRKKAEELARKELRLAMKTGLL